MDFPEDFWTDSPIHISKLSDGEIRNRKVVFTDVIEKHVNEFFEGCDPEWDQGTAEQYRKVLEKRESYSLPLPDPLDMTKFENKDFLAIFTKMHSRSFARSMRLCKDVNKLLSKNLTKFSVRIRESEIQIADDRSSEIPTKVLKMRRGAIQYRWIPIEDPLSVVPFTFTGLMSRWDGESFRDVFGRMKYPFLNRAIGISDDTRLHPTPWMAGLENLLFTTLDTTIDSREAVLENWKLVKDLKPKEFWFSVYSVTGIPIEELLNSAPTVSISMLPEDYGITRLVKQWRDGEWNHKAKKIHGSCNEGRDDIDRSVADCFSFVYDGFTLVFVPSPDNSYLVMRHTQENIGEPFDFIMITDVRFISEILPVKHELLLVRFPIDFSAYNGDLDSLIDPQAYCALFSTYAPEEE